MASLLQMTDITLTLNHCVVLHDLDFDVAEGEIHALLGIHGSGKSTLALMVMGCRNYLPETGGLTFTNQDIKDWPINRRARAGISLVWQEPSRFEGMSVQDYLHLDPGWRAPEACLEAVGMDPADYLHRMVDKSLNGGERKRIELASMLAMQPKLAMLDEPTAGVDVLSLEEVTEAILALRQGGTAVLLMTHQEDLAACADRASQICGGRIVFSGAPGDVAQHYRGRSCIRCDGSCADDA